MSTTDDAMKKIADTIENARKKAEPMIEEARKKAAPVIEEAKKKAEPVIEGARKKAAPAAETVKKQAGKAASAAKKAGRGITDKVAEVTAKSEVFIQYGDYEIRTDDMVKRVRETYVAEGHKISDIRELQVYIKPGDRCAYYVINHHDTGKIDY